MLSLQASYAAPLLLLAQNRQDDRDRVSLQQDRQRAERNLSDTEYLTRELASLRIALREVATRDYVRAELRTLLEDMLEAQEELRTHDPSGPGSHESPRDKVKEKLKEKRDKQRSPRTQQIPRVKPSHVATAGRSGAPAAEHHPPPEAHPYPRKLSTARMSATLEQAVHAALATVIDPELRRPITELGMVESVEISDDGRVRLAVLLTIAGCPLRDTITADCEKALSAVPGVTAVEVELKVMTQAQRDALKEQLRGAGGQRGIPFNEPGSLTKVYAVASGKGGVGKSSVTVNLACALAAQGLRVGIVDADVYGFSVPALMGITQAPTRVDDMILPPVAYGVKVISIGMFVTGNQPVAWRGPMLHRALEQFLTDVYFGDLDALFLDLPPGTGDIAISVAQLLPKAEILVVTTPQAAAADVAERAGAIATQTGQSRGRRHREHVLPGNARRRPDGTVRKRRRGGPRRAADGDGGRGRAAAGPDSAGHPAAGGRRRRRADGAGPAGDPGGDGPAGIAGQACRDSPRADRAEAGAAAALSACSPAEDRLPMTACEVLGGLGVERAPLRRRQPLDDAPGREVLPLAAAGGGCRHGRHAAGAPALTAWCRRPAALP